MDKLLRAKRAKVWILHLKHPWSGRRSLSINVIREICSYIADLELPQVTSNFLRFFNCETSTWGPQVRLRTRIQANTSSRWMMLNDGRLFCSGGGKCQVGFSAGSTSYAATWKGAYILGLSGVVEQLPDMLTARYYHGIIQVHSIYTFGGCKL